jgi:GT2 family glycosyltransferase/glycosyltransferase involved in cell wall biosynthesis
VTCKLLRGSLANHAGTALSQHLKPARLALEEGTLGLAIRHVDRAWRALPDESATIAPIYGRLLLMEGMDHYAALGLLHRALKFAPNADTAALIALTLLRLDRPAEARERLQATLSAYCVESLSLLDQVAGEILRHPGTGAVGWVGRGPRLELIGELAVDEESAVLDVAASEEARFSQILRFDGPPSPYRRMRFEAPSLSVYAPLEVRLREVPLIGSGLAVPEAFGLDARTRLCGNRVAGWAHLAWRPQQRLRLKVEDEHGQGAELHTEAAPIHARGLPFELSPRARGLRGDRLSISARLPDGAWQALPDSPLLREPAVIGGRHGRLRLGRWAPTTARAREVMASAPPVDVIVPVYRDKDATLACLDSVLSTVGPETHIVVVDDATDDATLAAALDELSAQGRITLLRNRENLGFVASVNRALALHPEHDVVLLNSDTLVFSDWLERLRAAAYSAVRIATVTPLSNSGSIASYPHAKGAQVAPEYAAGMHALAGSTHAGATAEIPVGVGFCLYIRRESLKAVGELDAAVFGKGYGEEVDFCLRTKRKGWSHRLAADVFVYHAGGVSFGGQRAALLDRSQRLLNLRYPGYDRFIESFLAQEPLHPIRRRLDEHRLSAFQGRFVLLVTLAMSGGVARFVDERAKELRARGLHPLILRPVERAQMRRCELWTDALDVPNLQFEIPKELGALARLLRSVRLDAIEIQHFLHLDARVIELVRTLSVPYDVFVHDYAWLCPRVTLIDGSGRYCGEPALAVCERCVRRNGSSLGEKISVATLRRRSDVWLREARRIIAPSADAAARIEKHFGSVDVLVRPPTAADTATLRAPPPTGRKVVRVVVPGAIGDHKGYKVLLACARDAQARRLPIEFVIVGYTRKDRALLETGRVFITGPYAESEAPHLLQREQPDVIWLPSVWPETWCYALDYALRSQKAVVAFDLGAIAERLRAAGKGCLLPIGLAPRAINDRLLKLPRSVQSQQPGVLYDANMGAPRREELVMNKNSDAPPPQVTREEGISASVQVLPLPPGLYLFSVKAAAPTPSQANGELVLPAVHVGLGPGVRPEQVEFVAGPGTQGAWLFAPGDLLVTKVNGSGATLVMTSVRAPRGEVLSIKVERLEARAETAGAAAPAVSEPRAVPSRDPRLEPYLPVQIGAHVRARGDMIFADVPWAGRIAPGLWIEAFCVRPLALFGASDIEYKGLTGSGFETPWLTDDKMCGTKGMAVPLVGFAVRFQPSAATADYDCEYSGYFQSGTTVGPLRNGAPCRSTVANDPLEGIQVRLVRRVPLATAATNGASEKADAASKRRAKSAEETPTARKAPAPARSARRS